PTTSPLTLITPPPPPSTLFPYTTLFRSPTLAPRIGPRYASFPLLPADPARDAEGSRDRLAPADAARRHGPPGGGRHLCVAAASADRKSTRLNSSHLVISYAVFCLNKKKQ